MDECTSKGCSEGWLHHSNRLGIDICEDCHGTGWASPCRAFIELEELRELAWAAKKALDGNLLITLDDFGGEKTASQSRAAARLETLVDQYFDER